MEGKGAHAGHCGGVGGCRVVCVQFGGTPGMTRDYNWGARRCGACMPHGQDEARMPHGRVGARIRMA
eukprot:354865-Chlamydomonas_euryale.AAC.8